MIIPTMQEVEIRRIAVPMFLPSTRAYVKNKRKKG
jgi:hypothetical protein